MSTLVRSGRSIEAALYLLLAWLALRLLPFRWVVALLSPRVKRTAAKEESIAQVARSVRTAARRVPWPAVCFPQGIAAQRMLCRRGIAAHLHYGIAKSEGGTLEAHVWVTVGDVPVVGGETAERFTLITTFSPVDAPGYAFPTSIRRMKRPAEKP